MRHALRARRIAELPMHVLSGHGNMARRQDDGSASTGGGKGSSASQCCCAYEQRPMTRCATPEPEQCAQDHRLNSMAGALPHLRSA